MLRRLVGVAVVVGAGIAGYKLIVEPWRGSWGVDPAEQTALRTAVDDCVARGGIG